MIDGQTRPQPSPYLLGAPPSSAGRIFLARAFEHYCALHFGYSGEEIATAFRGEAEAGMAGSVRMAARLIGEAFARSTVRVWARPIGGGEPVELKASAWELDDFDGRFATSAIDPKQPFAMVEPTSWLFVDMDGWNDLVEASLAEHVHVRGRRTFRLGSGKPVEEPAPATTIPSDRARPNIDDNRLVRLPEVKRLTGMSRSTIYRRMGQGRFPLTAPLEGNMAAWREGDVSAWLADPR